MTRGGRQRHLFIWLLLAPLLAAGLVLGVTQRLPEAISEGPVALPLLPEDVSELRELTSQTLEADHE